MTTAGWVPKVVALDIDGTLIEWVEGGSLDAVVRPAVIEAIQRAHAAGARIVLASGRSPHSLTAVADQIGLPPAGDEPIWICASNGSVIVRHPPTEVVHEELFDARPAVEAIIAAHPDVLVAVEHRGVGYRLNAHFPDGELDGEMVITPVAELVAEPVSRVIIRDPRSDADDFIEMGHRLGLTGIAYTVGFSAWLDLAPAGVSKASGIAYICDKLGIDAEDVLAIGDGSNDLEMFEWAGRSVAMGNAPEHVRAAADHVTAAVHEDGAAVELDQWFPA